MATTGVTNIAKRAYNVETSPQFDGYSAVRIYVGTDEEGKDIVYEAGNVNGRVLEIQNPMGTPEMATNILNEIRGYQYQPVTANDALLDPSAEIGDGVTINGVYSGVFARATQFGRLMASEVGAPTDEEIAHEYSVESAQTDREFSRFVKETKTSLALTATEISAEVERATTAEETLSASITLNANGLMSEITRAQNAEESLSSSITQTASDISAQVTSVTSNKLDNTRTNSTFGWKLTSSSFKINSDGNKQVFYADKNGIKISGNAEVTGKITATSGYIGTSAKGFVITASSMYNGKSSYNSNDEGVYIGTDGIALGSSFKVDKTGKVAASNLSLTGGSINIGNKFNVDASGNITASGSFTIKDSRNNVKFQVDSNGNISANNLFLNGTLTMTTGNAQTSIDAYDMAIGAADGYSWANDLSYSDDGWNYYTGEQYAIGGVETANSAYDTANDAYDMAAEAKGWIDCAGMDYIGVGDIYGTFHGDHYGTYFMQYGYSWAQLYLTQETIGGKSVSYVSFVTW